MTHLQQSLVTLRIWGDDLVPAEITARLGGEPTFANLKGQPIVGVPTDHVGVATTGSWHLRAPDCEPGDIDSQVRELLGGLTSDLAVWRRLRETFGVDLFCGLFMGHGNEGLAVSPSTLVALGVRGIELSLDIYAPRVAEPAVEPRTPAPSRKPRPSSDAFVSDLLSGLGPQDDEES
jgi:hypothetical protein